MNFKLIFDDSIVFDKEKERKSITERINLFQQTCLKVNPEAHASPYLKLSWGEFLFTGQLTQLKINFTLFTPDGIPIRAELDCNFQVIHASLDKARVHSTRSPDMTRVYTIKAGDSLPLICYEFYGSTKYYLQIARRNNLVTPTKILPGQRIVLPPLADELIS